MNRVTEVQIIPIKAKDGLVAFASVVVNESLFLGSIGVHSKIDGSGYRLTYPTKNVGGKEMNVYHPINCQTSRAIEDAIIEKVKNVIEGCNVRYSSFDIGK